MKRILEICIDSVESGIIAANSGADRVELCDNLLEGGTTPSIATIKYARRRLGIEINVIIRPRGGDFLYSELEFDIMKEDIRTCLGEGVNGIVTGVLQKDGSIDIERTSELIELAKPLTVTFHRAFDMTSDLNSALESIIKCGATRILTSGGGNKAPGNVKTIIELLEIAGDRIIIMPGSGINENNIAGLVANTRAKEFHLTGRKTINSSMDFRNNDISMGGSEDVHEYERKVTDSNRIRKVREILDSFEW